MKDIRRSSWTRFAVTVAFIIIIASVLNMLRVRLDLTEDRRFTLAPPTVKILEGLKNDLYIQVYLDGEIPIPLKNLKRSVKDMLEEFRIASDRKIDYEFINPSSDKDIRKRNTLFESLEKKGLNPILLHSTDEEGGTTQKKIFPGMIINYNGVEVPVNFLENNKWASTDQNILHSEEGLEYQLIQTIATITAGTIHKVAFLEGDGELSEQEVADITWNLHKYFTVDRGRIGGMKGILDAYTAVIIAAPLREFREADKLVIDQYIMNGGKVLWLVDEVAVNTDSLSYGSTAGLYHPLNIEDQLFRYGARINPVIVQDIDCDIQRFAVSTGTDEKQTVSAPWLYYPLLTPNQHHPLTRNLNKVLGKFVNTIDTVGLDPHIRKTILLTTSQSAKTLSPPTVIMLRESELAPDEKSFTKSYIPVAVLLEGTFTSAFKNRMVGNLVNDPSFKVRTSSANTKMIVVADGDIIRNDLRHSGSETIPLTLGQNQFTGQIFGNRDFIVNCLNYLADNNGLMELRSREMKMRLLNRQAVRNGRIRIEVVNILLPILIVIASGIFYSFLRKRKYTRHSS